MCVLGWWGLRSLSRSIFWRWYKSLKLRLLVWCLSLDGRLFLSELLIRCHSSRIITEGASVSRNLQTVILLALKDKRGRYFWIFLLLLLWLASMSLELKRKRNCWWKLCFHAFHRGDRALWFNLNRWCLSFLLLLQGIVNWAKVYKLLGLGTEPQGATIS